MHEACKLLRALWETGLHERVSLAQIIFCSFFVILAQHTELMAVPFNRSYLPGQSLSKYKHWNIFITARYWSKLFYLHRVLEFGTQIFSSIKNCLPQAVFIVPQLSSTQVYVVWISRRSKVAPKSLQSRTLLSLVRHMRGAALGPGHNI